MAEPARPLPPGAIASPVGAERTRPTLYADHLPAEPIVRPEVPGAPLPNLRWAAGQLLAFAVLVAAAAPIAAFLWSRA